MRNKAEIKRTWLQLAAICLLIITTACTTTRPHNGSGAQAQDDTTALYHSRWVLAGFPDTSFVQPEKDIYFRFEPGERTVVGFAGCNGFRGQYDLTEKKLRMSKLAATKMWCNHAPTEQYFLSVLEQTDRYEIAGDSLLLLSGDQALAQFYAVQLQ
jgi:heat shock protein HslJ